MWEAFSENTEPAHVYTSGVTSSLEVFQKVPEHVLSQRPGVEVQLI